MKLFAQSLLDDLTTRAGANPRARAHLNIHESPSDLVQRFFVVTNRNSYFRPHRHLTKSELATVLRGRVHVLTFDDRGTVTGRYDIGEDAPNIAYETPRATWHTLVADTDGTAFLEVKEGPYDPATASEFAAWSPAEGTPTAAAFLEWVRRAQPGDKAP
ncbi:MAG TPA: WbuC family cupin fold metalloprotein [Steroidobacteraceae bacterium]|nr:WbuC family cupin fold metalloprotein [Steroidobacteraceae bacterium]